MICVKTTEWQERLDLDQSHLENRQLVVRIVGMHDQKETISEVSDKIMYACVLTWCWVVRFKCVVWFGITVVCVQIWLLHLRVCNVCVGRFTLHRHSCALESKHRNELVTCYTLLLLFRACVSFGPRNRSIGAAAKSQVFPCSLCFTSAFIPFLNL